MSDFVTSKYRNIYKITVLMRILRFQMAFYWIILSSYFRGWRTNSTHTGWLAF